MGGCVDGRMTNLSLFMLCKRNIPLITQNAWPAHNLSSHVNCREQTSVIVIIINLNFMCLSKRTAKGKHSGLVTKLTGKVSL